MKTHSSKQFITTSQDSLLNPYKVIQRVWKNIGTLLSSKEDEQERLFFALFTAEQDTKK